jgi:hypothetical protein
MKYKDCEAVNCPYKVTGSEAECQYRSEVIKLPDEWQDVRIQAAIAAMQAIISIQRPTSCPDFERLSMLSVKAANALVKELKKK